MKKTTTKRNNEQGWLRQLARLVSGRTLFLFWTLKILELFGVYLLFRLGYIIAPFVLQDKNIPSFWTGMGFYAAFTGTLVVIAVSMALFLLVGVTIVWIDKNKEWARKISKRVSR